uniref:RPW8 domain-containing protein n=1 Tax=Brassica oleracea var. oleracea TaxID=109376 RepID=A0A0D3D8F6_BRAOL
MPISDVASLLGGAALGAPVSVIFNLLMEEVMKVKDFKPISRDLLSIMQRLVPIINKIDSMSQGSGPSEGELNFLFETMKRAEDMQDFQLIQYKYQLHSMSSLSTKIDILSDTVKGSAELFVVPQPETVTIFWLLRPLRELKKMLLEDHVVTVVVSAPSACGKTMLVSKLCHDADVKGKFKQIFFITVSKPPNVSLIVQRFLQYTGREAKDFEDNMDAKICIQQLLQQLGENGPILLVLDDVWPEDESLLDTFLIQLPDYKILVTSRFEFLRFGPTFSLEPLIDEDVKNLFMDCTPHPNCLTCAKRNDILLKVLALFCAHIKC